MFSWLIPACRDCPGAAKEVKFFSEAVQCYAKIYTPKGFTTDSKAPAVVLAPAAGDTAASIEKYAAQLAARGIVAMAIDYRGWGKSGGFLYLAEPVRWDDRLRFSQHTAKMRVRRGRLIPDAQILDIRNAISYLQGEPGVDRARIGLWGAGLAGGHVVAIAGVDFRVKAAVAQTPIVDGHATPRKAMKPTPAQQTAMVRLARNGQAPATAAASALMNDEEAKLALASTTRSGTSIRFRRRPPSCSSSRKGCKGEQRHERGGRVEAVEGTEWRDHNPGRDTWSRVAAGFRRGCGSGSRLVSKVSVMWFGLSFSCLRGAFVCCFAFFLFFVQYAATQQSADGKAR